MALAALSGGIMAAWRQWRHGGIMAALVAAVMALAAQFGGSNASTGGTGGITGGINDSGGITGGMAAWRQ